MRTLTVFNSITLDGFFTGKGGDLGWAHADSPDPEFQAFTQDNARGGGMLAFGRKTYEMMASFWPTEEGRKTDPVVANKMTSSQKLVFSRTMKETSWENTRIVKSDPVAEIRKLKEERGPDIVVMGSGTIVSLLARAKLIDRLMLVVKPVAIGIGRPMFEGMEQQLQFELKSSRAFKNGSVFLDYRQVS
jgi:dihydrofolate reductase